MQETRPKDLTPAQAAEQGKLRREFFSGNSQSEIIAAMNDRLEELPDERLVRRKRVLSSDPCPCGSGRKFRACHFLSSLPKARQFP